MKIFISYGHNDAIEFAEKLATWLKDQGYEPWLDKKDGIISGEPFDIRIEQGISECSILIALISPSSIRYESYCRNEWLFAQSIEKPIIPLRLANINPPLVIINLHYEDAFADTNMVFDNLSKVIKEVIANGKPRYREWIQNNEKKIWWSNREKLNFSEELRRYGKSFIGRDWLFMQLEQWVKGGDTQLALIRADSGWGKSAFAAQLTTRLNVRSVHFCTSSNIKTCEPSEWIKDLIYQLAVQFDVYRKRIEVLLEPNWGVSSETLFRSLIVDLLNEVERKPDIEEPWVFVIDSLDESLSVVGPALSDLLAWVVGIIPAWIKIIATSRPQQTIISKLSIQGVKHFNLKASDRENHKDLKCYIELRIRQICKGESEVSITSIVERIAVAAEGNFQYIKVLLDSVSDIGESKELIFKQLNQFPSDLIGLYDRIFRKRFNDLAYYKKEVLPIIDCLIASKEPLSHSFLVKSCKLDDDIAHGSLLTLSQFLNRTDTGYRFFHQSIVEWLSKFEMSTDFTASKMKGHQMLADSCWEEFVNHPQNLSSYCKNYIAIHLSEVGRWKDLHEVVYSTDLRLLQEWTAGGHGNSGIICLNGIIKHLTSKGIENISIAGLSTQLARIYSLRGEYDNARNYLNLAASKTSQIHGRRIKAVAMHELGSLDLYTRDFHRASINYKKALYLCDFGRAKYHDEAASNLIGLATLAFYKYQIKRSLKLCEQAMARSKKANDQSLLIAAERMTGAAYKLMGNIQEASQHFNNALETCEIAKIRSEEYRILLLQGWLELDIAAMNKRITLKARPIFEKALVGAKESMDYYYTTEALLSIGWTYLKENNVSQAKHYQKLAQDGLKVAANPELKSGLDSWQIVFYYLNGEYDNAARLGLELIKECNHQDIRILQYRMLIILGAIYWHSNNIRDAEDAWLKAIKISNSISEKRIELIHAGIEMCKEDPLWIPQ